MGHTQYRQRSDTNDISVDYAREINTRREKGGNKSFDRGSALHRWTGNPGVKSVDGESVIVIFKQNICIFPGFAQCQRGLYPVSRNPDSFMQNAG